MMKPLEDLIGGRQPEDPEDEASRIREAAAFIQKRMDKGEGVIVHCEGGTGRTGTVIGAVLRLYGYDAERVLTALDTIHEARGKGGWPESPWQADLIKNISADLAS